MKMMSPYFLLISMLLLSLRSAAQSSADFYNQPYKQRNSGSFGKGAQIVSFKYGLGNLSGTGYLNLDLREKVSHANIGPLYLQYEYGLAEEIGIVGYAAYAHAKDVMGKTEPRNYYTNAFSMGAGVLYHFNKVAHVERLDLYAGLGIGFKTGSVKTNDSEGPRWAEKVSDHPGIFFIRFGARYYVVDNMAVHFELSPDKMSIFNTGLSLRL